MSKARTLLVVALADAGDDVSWVSEYPEVGDVELLTVGVRHLEAELRQTLRERAPNLRALVAIDQRFMGFLAKRALDTLSELAIELPTLIHPTASVAPSAQLGRGVRVAAGAVVGANCTLGDHSRVLERTVLSRGSRVGAYSTVDPGVLIGESVTVGDHCWLHAGLVVEPRTTIGSSCELGPGGVATGAVAEGTLQIAGLATIARIHRFG